MSRRWKVIWSFNLVFVLFGFLALTTPELRWPILFYFTGYITGLIVYSGGLDAEEREKAEWAFQDRVYESYDWNKNVDNRSEERSVERVAMEFDLSPSAVRSIVKLYKGDG